jgi:acetyl esterase
MAAKGMGIMKFMQFLTFTLARKPAKVGKERMVDTSQGSIRVLEYGFEDKAVKPLYIDMHGGGFILCTADYDEEVNIRYMKEVSVKIISIEYPKAPQNPYPIALNAVWEVILYYVKNAGKFGIDLNRMGIGGHSAGANLSAVTCLRAKERKDFTLRYQVLDYPPLDLGTSPFNKPCPKGAIKPKMASQFDLAYVGNSDPKNPEISPVYTTSERLKDLPPAIIILAGGDSLHDEGAKYAELLREAGVPVELHDYPVVPHGFTLKPGKESEEAIGYMAAFIKKHSY